MKAHQPITLCLLAGFASAPVLPVPPGPREQISMHYQRAQTALSQDQPDTAAREFRAILRLDPKNAAAHANLGMIAFKHQKYAEATEAFSSAWRLNPSLPDAQAFLGLSYARLGKSREAGAALEQSLRSIRNESLRREVGGELIRLAEQTNTPAIAIDALRELQRSSPGDPDVLYFAYRVYSDLAARAVSDLAKSAPGSARLHQVLAQAALSQDDMAGAEAEYRRALEIEPRLPGLHYELGKALLQSSQEDSTRREAEQAFEAALKLNPADANSEFGLGEIHSLRSNPAVAVRHYERALALRPEFVDAHISLGKALTALGQTEEAFRHFREAARLDPENEIAHYRLALALRRAGRLEEAAREQAIFQKLRESQPLPRSVNRQRPLTALADDVPQQ